MANIGDQLLQPEDGYIRYTFEEWKNKATFEGSWINYETIGIYTDSKDTATIWFVGKKLRLLGATNPSIYSDKVYIDIDDNIYEINIRQVNKIDFCILLFDIDGLDNTAHKITITNDGIGRLFLGEIDTDGSILTEEKYESMLNRCFIKSNNKYYTIEENNLVEITEEITRDLIENRGVSVNTLATSQSILPDKFKLIYMNNNTVDIKGIKSNKELIVASNNFSTKIADSIDYFKAVYEKNTNSSIKITFSIDNGVTWKGNNFEDLSVEIPLKPFSELAEEERTKWNTAKETIFTNGIDIENLESLDFNTLDFEYIRFAYVLSVTSADDTCNTTKLQWQFDAKGSMQLMDSSEVGIEVLSDSIKVTPKTEEELIKVNITNGTCSGLDNPYQDEDLTEQEIKNFVSEILS